MARSYKHSPIVKFQNDQKHKRLANKRVRKTKDLSQNKSYKKEYNSYDICDFKVRWDNPSQDVDKNYYEKCTKRK